LDGQAVSVELDPTQSERDRYGRLLAYVWLSDGSNFGDAILGVFGLGQISLRRNALEQARQQYRQALIDLRKMAPGVHLVDGLVYAASVEAYAGLHDRAQRLMGASEAWHDARGGAGRTWRSNMWTVLTRSLVPPASAQRSGIQARVDGRAMSLDAAVAIRRRAVIRDLSSFRLRMTTSGGPAPRRTRARSRSSR
jgi:hypothetical protein